MSTVMTLEASVDVRICLHTHIHTYTHTRIHAYTHIMGHTIRASQVKCISGTPRRGKNTIARTYTVHCKFCFVCIYIYIYVNLCIFQCKNKTFAEQSWFLVWCVRVCVHASRVCMHTACMHVYLCMHVHMQPHIHSCSDPCHIRV
jgi:hypothetical protein